MLWALFVLGLALGLVINVLADNLPPDEHGVRHPPRRPACRQCGRTHAPLYWLGLAGLLLRRGRCEHCGARRRLRPVVVEVVTALSLPYLWTWASRAGGPAGQVAAHFVAAAVIVLSFILIAVIDIEHRLILRVVVFPVAGLVALAGFLDSGRGWSKTLFGGLAGFGIMFAVYMLGELYTRVQNRIRQRPLEEVVFGGGDVNLAAVVGFAVGWPGVLLALLIAILAGAVYSLAFILAQIVRRRYSPHSVIPYGPFLVLGALVIYFYGHELAQFWLSTH